MDCVVWTLQTSLTIFNLSEEKFGNLFNLGQKKNLLQKLQIWFNELKMNYLNLRADTVLIYFRN